LSSLVPLGLTSTCVPSLRYSRGLTKSMTLTRLIELPKARVLLPPWGTSFHQRDQAHALRPNSDSSIHGPQGEGQVPRGSASQS